VHGAFHDAGCFDHLRTALDACGIDTVAPDRPGHGTNHSPLGDAVVDAAALSGVLDATPGPKVLVGHSYGGAVIGQAAAGRSDVTHLVFLAAFVLEAGETVNRQDGAPEFESTMLNDAMRVHDDGTLTIAPDQAIDAFYNECDPAVAAKAVAVLEPEGLDALRHPVTAAGWHDIDSTYVVCTRDQAVPASLQRWLAARTGRTIELDCDHSPFLSATDDVAALLTDIATSSAP
jgi:pimeloyl-ACP methyl ester carboxylesterase